MKRGGEEKYKRDGGEEVSGTGKGGDRREH